MKKHQNAKWIYIWNTETTKRIMYPYKACPMPFRENRTEIMGRFSVQKPVKKATNGRRK